MKKLLLLGIIGFVVMAVYFDWFDSRDIWDSITGTTDQAMDRIDDASEKVSDIVDHTLDKLNKGE